MSTEIFCQFLNWIVYLLIELQELYIIDTSPFQKCDLPIFSPSLWPFKFFLIESFEEQQFFFFLFLVALPLVPTRDWTWALGSESAESEPLDHREVPRAAVLFFLFSKCCLLSCFICLILWPHHAACRMLAPRSGIKPTHPAVEVWSPNHWTARQVPRAAVLNLMKSIYQFYFLSCVLGFGSENYRPNPRP